MVKVKYEILSRDFFTCQRCGVFGDISSLQVAHMIKQGKQTERYIFNYIKKNYNVELKKTELKRIINDETNVVTSCARCNDYFNIYYDQELRDEKIKKIYEKEF